jgi:hypothetical protein
LTLLLPTDFVAFPCVPFRVDSDTTTTIGAPPPPPVLAPAAAKAFLLGRGDFIPFLASAGVEGACHGVPGDSAPFLLGLAYFSMNSTSSSRETSLLRLMRVLLLVPVAGPLLGGAEEAETGAVDVFFFPLMVAVGAAAAVGPLTETERLVEEDITGAIGIALEAFLTPLVSSLLLLSTFLS